MRGRTLELVGAWGVFPFPRDGYMPLSSIPPSDALRDRRPSKESRSRPTRDLVGRLIDGVSLVPPELPIFCYHIWLVLGSQPLHAYTNVHLPLLTLASITSMTGQS